MFECTKTDILYLAQIKLAKTFLSRILYFHNEREVRIFLVESVSNQKTKSTSHFYRQFIFLELNSIKANISELHANCRQRVWIGFPYLSRIPKTLIYKRYTSFYQKKKRYTSQLAYGSNKFVNLDKQINFSYTKYLIKTKKNLIS